MADIKITNLTSASSIMINSKFIITDTTTTKQVSGSYVDTLVYETIYLQVLDANTALTASSTGAMYFFVPDVLNGKKVVKFTAGITGTTPTGNTQAILKSNAGATIATATVTSGNRTGTTTSISNATLSTNDRISIDIGTVGGTPTGLDVIIKVAIGW